MKLAVVGVTGLVGQEILEVLLERNFPLTSLIPIASEHSVGKSVEFRGDSYTVCSVQEGFEMKPDIALFAAGGELSKLWAKKFADKGVYVIDNSSAWRMTEGIPLVVPEVNAGVLNAKHHLIANPNCSTIQLVMVLKPLHKVYGLKRVVVSTYQSTSGTGKQAMDQMAEERLGREVTDPAYPHPIDLNCIPHCDVFLDNDYTREEMKLVNEPRKILDLQDLKLTATAVRVPVIGGHSEAVNIEFENDFHLNDVKKYLAEMPNLSILDKPSSNLYPMPINAHKKDGVMVGRIRRDESQNKTMNCWVVADNLRKGAATNAVQIAELILSKGWC
tara:strand:- start:54 stop:1046 length:993 start_codon:yes stop_codon:yes gene_type:complete